jgi:hypothetical protein
MIELLRRQIASFKDAVMVLMKGDRAGVSAGSALKAVGYWNHDGWHFSESVPRSLVVLTIGFPHPVRLVEALGAGTLDDRVLQYLRSGHTRKSFMGLSYCRFGCEWIEGTACVTDGTWVWPEGLAHYVDVHNVPLPVEFLETMKHNRWKVPRVSPKRIAMGRWDSTFWVEWTAQSLGDQRS